MEREESQELVTEWFPTDYIHRHCPSLSQLLLPDRTENETTLERHQISTFLAQQGKGMDTCKHSQGEQSAMFMVPGGNQPDCGRGHILEYKIQS